jgi:pyruvate dehydrogenase E1 component alpha subunit
MSELTQVTYDEKQVRKVGLTDEDLKKMYQSMVLTRILDQKILSLQKQGRVGPYVPCSGEEGCAVGAAYALEKQDWVVPSYREMGAIITRGLSLGKILAQVYGNTEDVLKGRQMSNSWGSSALNWIPAAAPVGSWLPVAVGVGMAMKIKGKTNAVLTFFGDGGTSSSDFHTAMNFAGVFKSPVVFFCRNNGYAISLPFERQTASKTIAIKAETYGFNGVRINGNDVIAVYATTKSALKKAREGGGPTLIEGVTYRVGAHSTADDPTRYRERDEVDVWRKQDPLKTLKEIILGLGIWDEEVDTKTMKRIEKRVNRAVEQSEKVPPIPLDYIFQDVYAEIPWNLREEFEEAKTLLSSEGGSPLPEE